MRATGGEPLAGARVNVTVSMAQIQLAVAASTLVSNLQQM